jgi:hypothetical protein
MKRLLPLFVSLLAIAACTPQEPPPPPAAAAPGYAAGSPAAATNYYDGTYTGQFVQISPGPTGAQCPNIKVAPALTISNGVARFAALDLSFQGTVTPQGQLSMQSQGGQTFEGQIDPYFVLRGRVTGNCVYDATWQRYRKYS